MLLSGGGALLQNQAQQDQADEKRQILNRQMERDNAATDKATALVQTEGQNYGMDQRNQQLAANEDKAYQQAQTDIAGAGGALVDTAGDAGNVSADFLKDKASRTIDEGTRLTSIAREAAKNRSAGGLMNDDALRRAGLAGNLQNLWGTTKNMDSATRNDADSVQTPGYGLLGSIASAAGGAMAGKAGAGVSWDPDGSYGLKYARGIGR
ncbi:hypothetical protein RD110_08110 [Rhodoferax koreense]|uniref:Uncharacterized protein n=1 Tax=Rhodoferax koreensis TaxID=1842727 RepID=A0A1P8JTT4_9BURK|nr:hypothetical protein RD110_08110 [Rhodoferax koreense]